MKTIKKPENWLLGNGETNLIIRSRDWSDHVLGPIESWPQTLKTSLGICLNSRFPMLVWWGKDLIVFYNDSYIPLAGLKHPQYLGRKASEQWSEIWDSLRPLTEQVMTTGKATWAESMCLYMNRSGFLEETYFTFSYSPIIDESGSVVGIINPCQETTERVLCDRRLKSLRDLCSKGVKTIEEAGKVASEIFANNNQDILFSLLYLTQPDKKTAVLIGYSGIKAGSVLSPKVIDISSPSNDVWPITEIYQHKKHVKIDNLRSRFKEYLPDQPYEEGPDSAFVMPLISVREDMPIGFMVLGISPRLIFNEQYEGYFNLISQQKSIHLANVLTLDEEKKRFEELSELNKAKTDFFNNASHELRTPLMLILGPIENLLAEGDALTPQMKSEIEVVYRSAIRLLKLVNNLLDFSRIESHRKDILYEEVDLRQLTTTIASGFASAIENAGLKFAINCDEITHPVYVDKEMWENIIINLLSNAFKYTLNGSISLSLHEVGNHIELCVSDTGVGIPQSDLDKIFQRFYRVKGSRGRTHEGTGIGLALIKELIALHGGSIMVKSEVDKGSSFTACIPVGKDHIPADKIRSNLSRDDGRNARAYIEEAMTLSGSDQTKRVNVVRQTQKKKGKILIAEDNTDMRNYITNLLSNDYEVAAYDNGEKALKEIRNFQPDIILSDVMMPVMDGFQLIKNIRADKEIAEIPIILVSARAGQESTITGIDSGADDYLVKPFSAKELMARVKQNIDMIKLRRETSHLKDKFLNSITHDLRSPITAIIGYITLLHDGEAGDISAEQKEDLGNVLINAEYLLHLINQLLDLAKIKAGKLEFVPEKIVLKDFADEVIKGFKILLREKNMKLDFEFEGKQSTVMLDRSRLKQVLYNYLSNAIKYTPSGGSIRVKFKIEKARLRIEVADNGVGITKDKFPHLFEEFQQLNADAEQTSPGTGLGLSLTKRLVEAQGGKVGAESEFGRGSMFYAEIPLK